MTTGSVPTPPTREQLADLVSEVLLMEASTGEWAQRHREHALDLVRGLRMAFRASSRDRASRLCQGLEDVLGRLGPAELVVSDTIDAVLAGVDSLRVLIAGGSAPTLDPTELLETLARFAGSRPPA